MSRKLYIVLFLAIVGFANCFPNEEVKPASETNQLETDDESRIVGGRKATKNQFPYMVSIQKLADNGRWFSMCGGSVISPRTILTAAHCMSPKPTQPLRIVAGTLRSLLHDPDAQIRNVALLKPHPDYHRDETGRAVNDIGLMIINTPLKLGPNVQPIALSTMRPLPGTRGFVSGWGDTIADRPGTPSPELLFADAQIYPNPICEQTFGKLSPVSQICVGKIPTAYRESVCKGDSGGPIVIHNKVEGVVSYSVHVCGTAEVVFTAVSHFAPWIKQNTV